MSDRERAEGGGILWDFYICLLVVYGQVCGLGVIVPPGSEVVVSLAGAAVHLDLDTTHLQQGL